MRCALLRASSTINWHPLLNRLKVKGHFNKSSLALRHAHRMKDTFLALQTDYSINVGKSNAAGLCNKWMFTRSFDDVPKGRQDGDTKCG